MKFGIETIFRVAVIMLLLLQQAGVQYFYNKANKFEKEAIQTKEFYKEKEIIREVNAEGQMKATVDVTLMTTKLFAELMNKKLDSISTRFNSKVDQSSTRVHALTDMSITTRLAGLKMAKVDTTINVITVIGDTTKQKGKVGHYKDGYNQLDIMDSGDSYEVLPGSKIRNDVTTVIYEGEKPKFLWIIPKFWKQRPFLSETYLYNPLSGMDTVSTIVTERIKQKD